MNTSRLYVSNIAHEASKADVRDFFAKFGVVREVYLPVDERGARRGFGFVTMASEEEGAAAIAKAHGARLCGRPLSVAVAKPRPT